MWMWSLSIISDLLDEIQLHIDNNVYSIALYISLALSINSQMKIKMSDNM